MYKMNLCCFWLISLPMAYILFPLQPPKNEERNYSHFQIKKEYYTLFPVNSP